MTRETIAPTCWPLALLLVSLLVVALASHLLAGFASGARRGSPRSLDLRAADWPRPRRLAPGCSASPAQRAGIRVHRG